MKSTILIVITLTLILTGCSTTNYLSLTENDKEQIEQKLNAYEYDEDIGAEITLSKKNGTEINGELLSVRDSTIIICSDFGLSEKELALIKHSIYNIRNSEIKELTIEGCWRLWSGIGYGALGGALLGAATLLIASIGSTHITQGAASVIGGVLGALVGGIAGGVVGALSTDDIILREIPPGYDFSLLKSLARYRGEEPKYLKLIK